MFFLYCKRPTFTIVQNNRYDNITILYIFGRMVDERERTLKGSGLGLIEIIRILPQGLRRTTKNLGQNSVYPGRVSNRLPSENECRRA
jgi:hypothetical protein